MCLCRSPENAIRPNFKTDQKPDYPTVNDMIIISIGTGSEAKSYPFKKMENAGKLAWIGFNRHSSSANAETVDYQLSQMFQTLGSRNQKNYYRINPSLKNASPSMDNVRKKTLKILFRRVLLILTRTKKC